MKYLLGLLLKHKAGKTENTELMTLYSITVYGPRINSGYQ